MKSLRPVTVVPLAALVVMSLVAAGVQADTIAYNVPAGTAGTQAFDGPLGMDFDVNQPIFITRLGVFDDNSDGLARDLTGYLWDRNNTAVPVETVSFTTADPGTLIGGSRFKPLAAPLYLPAGFQGRIVGENYGTGERDGNIVDGSPRPWTINDGGGLISFVGTGRYGTTQGVYPNNNTGGPVNRFAAGTFTFAAALGIESGLGMPMYVANPSFELPGRSPGGSGTNTVAWTPTGNAGDFNGPGSFSDPIPDGTHVAYATLNASLTSDPIQGETLLADTLYIMEAKWGHRSEHGTPVSESMILRAGGVGLGRVDNTDVNNGPVVAQGKFETARGYFTANHNATIGSALDIVLTNEASSAQAIWDDVRLVKITDAAVEIVNPSFEDNNVPPNGNSTSVPGWSVVSAGTLQYSTSITPADGEQVAYVLANGSLTQTLTEVLRPNHRYFLLVDVADRSSTSFAGYSVELLAGGQSLALEDSLSVKEFSAYPTAPGEFLTTSVIDFFTSGADPLLAPLFGQPLGISLGSTSGSGQTIFDNVRLFAQPIPEPQTGLLLLLGALGLLGGRRRKG